MDRALRELATLVTDELARIADAATLGAAPSQGPVGDALARRLRHGRLDALEHSFERWADRRHDNDARPAIDQWREFLALKEAYDAAVKAGGLEVRRLAFPHVFTCANNMASWLWNKRDEYPLAHAIFQWLLDEALVVGDTEAIDLSMRNTQIDVPTRSD